MKTSCSGEAPPAIIRTFVGLDAVIVDEANYGHFSFLHTKPNMRVSCRTIDRWYIDVGTRFILQPHFAKKATSTRLTWWVHEHVIARGVGCSESGSKKSGYPHLNSIGCFCSVCSSIVSLYIRLRRLSVIKLRSRLPSETLSVHRNRQDQYSVFMTCLSN